jgi:tetratricopeptide (TPR) repeat protein
MALSFLRKIRKILEKPELPAHIRERNIQVVIPWHESLWRAIRPPGAVNSTRQPMRPGQRRMIRITLGVLAVAGAAGWGLKYVSDAPLRADAAFQQGVARLGPGDFVGAVAKFTESIQIKETPTALLERGNANSRLGQVQLALADWARAIQIDPNFAPAFTARGTYFRVAGDLSKALTDLDHSLQIMQSVDAYYQRAQVYHALGEYQKAVDDYSEAIALRREAPYVYLARSVSRKALGDEEGYRKDVDIAQGLQHFEGDR